ncbi:GNAT family N-acetyltransferase [Kitasatospora sp. NPDC059646]|uniref:GNAT family N-acetyltransferase n=1 Tax=Kitasatospora sp. NPDC059646 TaxID=3346893 RepID=UPI00367A4BA0
MGTDLTVRRAGVEDARVLAELRWAFKREDHEGPVPAERPVAEAEEWLRKRLRGGPWRAWVAERDGAVCGHVFLHLVERVPEPFADNDPLGYVTNFYVAPPFRNRGAGAALLAAVDGYAKGAGLNTLIVWPSERSAPLYRRAGFRAPEELLERPVSP